MPGSVALITHPIALCALVLSLVFGLLAKMWSSKGNPNLNRQLFRLAVFVSITALVGGFALAWYQTPRAPSAAAGPAANRAAVSASPSPNSAPSPQPSQSTTGAQSDNIQNSGSGTVSIQYGDPPKASPASAQEKSK